MIRILGRRTSNNVQKVLWLLDTMAVPYEQIDMGGPFGQTQTDEYLKLNPNGTVPTMVDGTTVLWESNAILRYLASKYDSPLYDRDLVRRGHIEKWMDWQVATLSPAFRSLFIAIVRERKPLSELGSLSAASARLFNILDKELAQHDFIAGNQQTLADIAIGPMIYRWYALNLADPDTVHLKGLLDKLSAMPAFKKNVMIDLA